MDTRRGDVIVPFGDDEPTLYLGYLQYRDYLVIRQYSSLSSVQRARAYFENERGDGDYPVCEFYEITGVEPVIFEDD